MLDVVGIIWVVESRGRFLKGDFCFFLVVGICVVLISVFFIRYFLGFCSCFWSMGGC